MGNSNSNTTNPSSSAGRTQPRATSQHVYVSSSSPYSGSSSQSQSSNTGSSRYSSNAPIREDNPRNFSTYQSSYTTSSSGARPKQYPPLDPFHTSGSSQPVSGYPTTSRLSTGTPSYTSGISQQSSSAYPGTSRLNVTSPTQKKALYMARSLSSLCARIDQGIDWSNASRLAGKATVSMLTANKAYEQKDEEKAYILYERYARMWAHIRESTDYKNTPITFDNILGRTDIQTAYDRIDELKLSLESRYPTLPVLPSQVPRTTTQGQTSASVSMNMYSAEVRLPQRQTFQPLEPQRPLAMNVTSSSSSNTRSSGSMPSQTSSNTRSVGSTLLQASSNTRHAGSTPSQPSSNTRNAGSTPKQTGRSQISEHNQVTGTSQHQQSSAAKKDQVGVVNLKGMRENLLCPICLDLFENAKSLPCGHVICEGCIGEWVASKGGVLSCPTCKTKHSLPSSGVAGLPTNFALNNLVEELKKLDKEGLDSEVAAGEKEQPPNTATTPSLMEEQRPNTATIPSLMEEQPPNAATIPSLVDMEPLQPLYLSGTSSAETSFLEKNTKSYKDTKGSTIRMRVQLCDFDGNHLRGKRRDKVEATVLSPSDEKENVSVSLMKRDGDYSLSFIPSKIGVHLVEAYLDNTPVRGSPLKVVVHPSTKLDTIINNIMHNPKDVVAHESMIYATDEGTNGYLSTDWQSNMMYPCEDTFGEDFDSFGIDASNDKFYVTIPNKSCVYVYDDLSTYMNNFGKRVLERPTGIVVSSTGMIYVADSMGNTIDVFRPNFSHMVSIQAGGNANNCSLALLALNPTEDRLIAADQGTNCFKIFDVVNMKILKMIKTRVQQAPARPFGVAVDEDSNILVSVTFDPSKQGNRGGHNQQNSKGRMGAIITYNSNGYFLGKFGDNELKNPRGLCIVEDKVVVVDQGAEEPACLKVFEL